MRREVLLEEISDGKRYGIKDMVKADCQDCTGCSDCCKDMGNSIVLDPLDVYRLKTHLDMDFHTLLQQHIELNIVDHIILPNLKMTPDTKQCSFLDETGRCSIHSERPGICRIFPLGRVYENREFTYFLQVNECTKKSRSKIKLSKWIACNPKLIKENQSFITQWHYFLKDVEQLLVKQGNEEVLRKITMQILQEFYLVSYENEEALYEKVQQQILQIRLQLGIENNS